MNTKERESPSIVMAIKGGTVMRTATAAARKFLHKQISDTPPASLLTPPVSASSGVGTFLGIPKLPRSEADLLISKYIRLSQVNLKTKRMFFCLSEVFEIAHHLFDEISLRAMN